MAPALEERRKYSQAKQTDLQTKLTEAQKIVRGKACAYATGSFGRGEACQHSDLDLFIVGQEASDSSSERALSNLDEICLKAELIRATRDLGFPEFSGDGEYLEHYTVSDLVKSIGSSEDDARNTFTARLLLLLESKPLIGEDTYSRVIDEVIAAYWRDYPKHQQEFLPAFLSNDILRLWRTFCVNYEARTQSVPEARRQKRRLKNYKLKHSRLLTCYSALLYLMTIWNEKGTVSPDDALGMVKLTPTERLERMVSMPGASASVGPLNTVIDRYAEFLEQSNAPELELLQRIGDDSKRRAMFASGIAFAEAVFAAVAAIGGGRPFHRMLVV